MENYKEVEGNLITMALNNEFDVIVHGVNCQCVQKSGLAPQMVKVFQTDNFKMESPQYKGDVNKLGTIDHEIRMELAARHLIVVNAYTQFNYGRNHVDGDEIPFDYEAATLCFRKMNKVFKGLRIGLPKIGSGLAGGDWSTIKKIIQKEFKDCFVTIVYLK